MSKNPPTPTRHARHHMAEVDWQAAALGSIAGIMLLAVIASIALFD